MHAHRPSRTSRLKFGNLTQPTPLCFAPSARRPGAHHDLAIRACHDNLQRSGRIERGAKVRNRGGVGMLVLIDATPEGKKLHHFLRGGR
jgi:hypothetical protein